MFRFQDGYLSIGRLGGIPIRVHWFMPFALFMFSRFQFRPVHWAALTSIVLLHELGHAFFVRRAGAEVVSVDLVPIGGLCRWTGEATPIERALIAWGGVLAQALILMTALIVVAINGPPTSSIGAQVAWAAIESNLWMIALNLLPVRPLDGSKAWKLLPLAWQQFRRRKHERKVKAQHANLEDLRRRDRIEDRLMKKPPAQVKALVASMLDELRADPKKTATKK